MLSDNQRLMLIEFVRHEARRMLGPAEAPDVCAEAQNLPYGGLFVTLRNKGRLRGCMGTLSPTGAFFDALRDVTRLALHDPRFVSDPISFGELPLLDVEISILSESAPVIDLATLVAGRHGVVVTRDGRSGCFLPQVAVEHGWNIETLLTQCCLLKAGITADAWREAATRVEAFEVEVITESLSEHPGPGTTWSAR